MKSLAYLFLGATCVWAASVPCPTASLHVYDASGFSCTESAEMFSNFAFGDSGTENPLPTDAAILVTPLAAGGLQFGAGFAAPSGSTLDATITYTAMTTAAFSQDTLSILGFGQSGSAAIDVAESICVGAAFAANGTCSTGNVKSLNVFDNASGIQASATVALPAATILGIAKDISISGGAGLSSANLSLVDNATPVAVSTVPEPTTFLLTGGALLALAKFSRRDRR